MSKEFEEFRQAMRRPATRESMQDAAEKFERYKRVTSLKLGESSLYLVSLKYRATYPNAVKVDDIPHLLRTNEEFYNLMSRVVTGGK